MTFLACCLGSIVGYFFRIAVENKPVVLTCIYCRNLYEENPYSGAFCSALCAGQYDERISLIKDLAVKDKVM